MAFEPGQRRGPDVEAVRCGLKRDVLRLAQGTEGTNVWCRLRMDELVVDFPGDIPFEAAHDFLGVFAFGPASGDVAFGANVAHNPHERDVADGFVGLPVAAAAEPVARGFS